MYCGATAINSLNLPDLDNHGFPGDALATRDILFQLSSNYSSMYKGSKHLPKKLFCLIKQSLKTIKLDNTYNYISTAIYMYDINIGGCELIKKFHKRNHVASIVPICKLAIRYY